MNVFELVLSPFIYIIKQLFLYSYQLTGNYGISIILLSFAISLLLLPIFILIEKAKKKDDVAKLKMKPLIDEIKNCYKGQERYYYLKTLNRQFNYSPVRALIPILSLLLQIPFFIAAYQYLEHFEPLIGVSFAFIADLSQPDALFGNINFLPIAMTFVNLLTAYFYTKNGNTAERKQMLVVAGVFLILLFNLPAGLVLYWTMNNMFSFFRLFITNREAFKKVENKNPFIREGYIEFKARLIPILPKLLNTFFLTTAIVILLQVISALGNDFNNIFQQLISGLGISIGVTVSIALLVLMHKINGTVNYLGASPQGIKIQKNKPARISQAGFKFQKKNEASLGEIYTKRLKDKNAKDFILTILPTFKPMLFVFLTITIGSQVNWALQHSFNSIIQRVFGSIIGSIVATSILATIILFYQGHITLSIKQLGIQIWAIRKTKFRIDPTVYFSILFLSIYFYLAGLFYFTGINTALNSIALVFVLLIQLLGLKSFISSKKHTSKAVFITSALALIAIALFQLIGSFILLFDIGIVFNLSLSNIILAGFIFTLITIIYYLKSSKTELLTPNTSMTIVYSLALFYVLSLVFFWSPLIVYSSFPETFSFPAIHILAKNFLLFAILFASSYILYVLISKKLKFLFTSILVALSFVFFLNSFIIPVNVGTLQLGKYIEASALAMHPFIYLAEGLFLITIFLLTKWLLLGKYHKHVTIALVSLTLILTSQSLISAISGGDFFSKSEDSLKLPNTISFSKDKPNVIFIIPDTFMGMHMKYILEESPELKTELDGFVWYPNTLSVSTNTAPSISSMYVGHDFNLDILNQDNKHTMTEKITEASELFCNKVKEQGYSLTSTKMVYSKIDKNTYDYYLPNWHSDWNKWNKSLNIGGAKELDFAILWKNAVFYGSPLFIKSRIYDNGDWIRMENETNKNSTLTKELNFTRLLPLISDTNNDKGNFIYIHTKATHGPWHVVNNNGELTMNVGSYENQKWFINEFAKWIKWMKKNNVYDNTKIIMVADHSHNLPDKELNEYGGIFKWGKEGQEKLSARDFWRVNSLLMVKDFNSNGNIKEDWRFMSNADAPAIAFNENDPTKIEPPESRTLPVFYVGNLPRSTKKKYLPIYMQYEVKDSVYDPKNWTLVKTE